MPSVITFDTLAYAKKLKVTGVPDEQAKIQAEALKDIINTELVTKRDPAEAKIEIIKCVAGVLVAKTAIVATLVKLLLPSPHTPNQCLPYVQIERFLA